jgi:hypothetical protein
MDSSGFTSQFYGRVQYADIERIVDLAWYRRNPPTMHLKLKSGQKLAWDLTYRGSVFNSTKDAEVFAQFTDELQQRLSALYAAALKQDNPAPALVQEHPAVQLEREGKKNRNPVWAVPLTLGFALLALVRTCGKDWFSGRRLNFSEMAVKAEKRFSGNIEEVKLLVDSIGRAQGGVFLYSNDTGAVIKLLPDIQSGDVTGIRLFELTSANEQLERFMAHPDSFELKSYVVSADSSVKVLRKGIFNQDDSIGRVLYFRVYDPSLHVNPFGSRRGEVVDSATLPVFDLTAASAVYDTANPGKAIEEAFPGMKVMLAQVKHRPAFKLYLAARAGDGITPGLFNRSILALNKQLAAVGADTTKFVKKSFYTNP